MAPTEHIFKDYFSIQSGLYAQARPTYPENLFEFLSSLVNTPDTTWDCATGNGQAAVSLAKHFKKAIATDASDAQIKNAAQHPNVAYSVATAENSGLSAASIDLITVATALHWLNQPEFYREADRILKPGGILAALTYAQTAITPEIDAIVKRFTFEDLKDFWPPENEQVWEGYRNVTFPYELLPTPRFETKVNWNLSNLLNYLTSWSGTQRFIAAKGYNPLKQILKELQAAWGGEKTKREVTWELYLKVGRKQS